MEISIVALLVTFLLIAASRGQKNDGNYGPYSQYDPQRRNQYPPGPMRAPQQQGQFGTQLQDQPVDANAVQCTQLMQQEIQVCARSLQDLGFMRYQASTSGDVAVPWLELRKKSKTQFQQTCMAFNYWEECVKPYRQYCFLVDPVRSQFTVPHEMLNYVCKLPALEEVMTGWDCIQLVSSKTETIVCDSVVTNDPRFRGKSLGSLVDVEACKVLQNYSQCIRRPIYEVCGLKTFNHVQQAIQRPIQVFQPFCITGAATASVSLMVLILATVFSMLRQA